MTTSPELPSAEEVEKLREIEELRQDRLRFVALRDMDQAARVTETLTANARHLMVPSRWIVAYADRVAELERENERLREIGTLLIRKLYFNDHRHYFGCPFEESLRASYCLDCSTEDANTGQRLRALNYQSLAPPTDTGVEWEAPTGPHGDDRDGWCKCGRRAATCWGNSTADEMNRRAEGES